MIEAQSAVDTMQVDLRVIGRDSATYRRAAFYLHAAGDSVWRAVIAQRGNDAELLVRRRASEWGLGVPTLVLQSAFRDGDARTEYRIIARSTHDSLTLASNSNTWSGAGALALTPLLGWTMAQGVVTTSSPAAWGLHILWALVLVAPAAWFAA